MYYVYAYLRKSDLTPYYIGKGSGTRAYNKRQHRIHLPIDKSYIVFLETNLSEIGSLALERRMIAWYGRKDKGTGILQNMTDGGEGATGRIYRPSQETKDKIAETLSGYGLGVAKSDIHRLNIAKGKMGNKNPMFGLVPTKEHRNKISITMSGIPKEQVTCPHCNKVGGKPSMTRHHFNNCKLVNK